MLALARSADYRRSDTMSVLNRCQTDSARCGMDQQYIALLEIRQIMQCELHGAVHDRNGSPCLHRKQSRLAMNIASRRNDYTAETSAAHADHFVAFAQIAHRASHTTNYTSVLTAGKTWIAGVHPKHVQHVAEIQAHCSHFHLHVRRSQNTRN